MALARIFNLEVDLISKETTSSKFLPPTSPTINSHFCVRLRAALANLISTQFNAFKGEIY
jgi:hypothetical protein